MRILFHFLTLVTLVTLTGCDGADGSDHLTALVYSDLSQPSASKFQTSPANFTGISKISFDACPHPTEDMILIQSQFSIRVHGFANLLQDYPNYLGEVNE